MAGETVDPAAYNPPWRFDPFQNAKAVQWGGDYIVLQFFTNTASPCHATFTDASVVYAKEKNDPFQTYTRWYVWPPYESILYPINFTHWCDPPFNTIANYSPQGTLMVGYKSFDDALLLSGKEPYISPLYWVYAHEIWPITHNNAPQYSLGNPLLTEESAKYLAATLTADPISLWHTCDGDEYDYKTFTASSKKVGGGYAYTGMFVIKTSIVDKIKTFGVSFAGATYVTANAWIFAPGKDYAIDPSSTWLPMRPQFDYVWNMSNAYLEEGRAEFYVQKRPYLLNDPAGLGGKLRQVWPKDRAYSVSAYRLNRESDELPSVPAWQEIIGAPPLV